MSCGELRPARAEDLEGLIDLQAAWPALPPWTRAHFASEFASERCRLVVWDEEGAPVAFAALRMAPPEAEITTVAVRRDRLRRGIGRRLLDSLHELAREGGCNAVGLEVSARNDAAMALYVASGYHVVGRRVKYYNDGSDALLMMMLLA